MTAFFLMCGLETPKSTTTRKLEDRITDSNLGLDFANPAIAKDDGTRLWEQAERITDRFLRCKLSSSFLTSRKTGNLGLLVVATL